MHLPRLAWLVLAALAALGGCATPSETVVLLPEREGRATAVTVQSPDREPVVLDKPYAAVTLTPVRRQAYTATPEEVKAKFGRALDAQPAPPASFTLYFVENRDELTDASKRIFNDVFAEIARRPVPDIVVIGHTDTTGSDASNDALALKRAEAIRAELIRRGIAADTVQAAGRGKRELAVPTGDNVAEPLNRRVVILVR